MCIVYYTTVSKK